MCVWSAYAGKKEAAPLLMEAIKKTEGVWDGMRPSPALIRDIFATRPSGLADLFRVNWIIMPLLCTEHWKRCWPPV